MGIIEEDTSNNETETLEIVDSKEISSEDYKKVFHRRIIKALGAATAALISIISNSNKKETDVLGIAVTIGSILYAGWAIKKKIESDPKVKIK